MSKFTKLLFSPRQFVVDSVKKPAPKQKATALAAAKPAAAPKAVLQPKPKLKTAVVKVPAKAGKPVVAAKPIPAINPEIARRRAFFDGRVSMLTELVMHGEYEAFKKAWNHTQSDATSPQETMSLINVRAEWLLAAGIHDELRELAGRMIDEHKNLAGHFYKAQSYFVCGQYDLAKQSLQQLLYTNPNHADGIFLLVDITHRTKEKELGWLALERLALTSKRNKIWHSMSNLVDNDADLFRLMGNWDKWKATKTGPAYHKDVSEFVALGALRIEQYELSKAIWRDSMKSAISSKNAFDGMKIRKPSYSSRRAEIALEDINRILFNAGIEMFLVSGTLLGCVRENQLLGHDKDIDVGIWDKVDSAAFFDVVTKSGLFFILHSRSKEIIRLRHTNGIAIDVFYHYREKKDYWHGGIKMVWHNTPFELATREFLGGNYLIPTNYDLYLTENYGDWRTPKIAFDSAFDTPNGEAINDGEMAVHSFKGLMDSCIDQNWERVNFYLESLAKYKEADFAEKFRPQLMSRYPDSQQFLSPSDG